MGLGACFEPYCTFSRVISPVYNWCLKLSKNTDKEFKSLYENSAVIKLGPTS